MADLIKKGTRRFAEGALAPHTRRVMVTMDLPGDLTDEEVEDYVYDAIVNYAGQYGPEFPFRDLDNDSTIVKIASTGKVI